MGPVTMSKTSSKLLRGARALARHIFGSEDNQREVYDIAPYLPVFMLGGMLAGRPDRIDAALLDLEAKGIPRRKRGAKGREAATNPPQEAM